MSALLTTSSTVMCPHFGSAVLTTGNTRVLVDGAPVLLMTDQHAIRGCVFTLSGVPSPCLTIRWLTGTTQSKVGEIPMLLQSSVGLCLSGMQTPQGVAIVVQTQTQAIGV
jgi:hypothetical protein